MKKLYVQIKNALPINMDIQNAIDGAEYIGYDIAGFTLEDILSYKMDTRAYLTPFVGSIDGMTMLFKNMKRYPDPIDFPEEIISSGLLNREVKNTSLNQAIALFKESGKPVFIKPYQTKLFDGILISEEQHLNYLRGYENPSVWVCDQIDILSEHRAYIHKGKMVYCCNYSGDFRINPDYSYIDELISVYKNAPVAYTIDVAILKDGSMTVVEFNDFWAIGSYGMKCWDYAQMLIDRYFQIVKPNI